MAESLIEIKRKMTSTKKTSHITSAMQMVSGAKLNRSESASKNYQLYAKKVREVVTHLAASQLKSIDPDMEADSFDEEITDEEAYHVMLQTRPVKRTGYIVITSDKGLAGGYNSSIIKQTIQMLQNDHKSHDEYVLMTIGRTGTEFFKKRGAPIAYEQVGLSDQPVYDEIRSIIHTAIEMYQENVYDELYVCYNHHINSLSSQYRAEKMLPITDLDAAEAKSYEQEYILEPSEEAILDQLLPQYAASLIYGAILDAKTAEHAARMTAMKSATDNASNIIDELTLKYNHARQAAITQEITEIVGGAAALE
ncbi:F0F1 ATP synthase subunit gamma [Vagococcus lutrae]|uniref:ATP synthase gamma chain n=1 Tax=Vagococcus lutrae TaxID=81947 RepID=A0AAE9XE41_9ENTE|nr:F0F1 ATP synthase subunit gamma [Vagococcus lutrae]MDO5741622.1 F0F1 ATP synthase subunit gamma [Vagococcus sp.]MCO7151619.1 F0F1 ATP synthase subunit gamma [Vagococcus lutrae]MDT2806935.1 F0F1 ATP synthase subunit gamma [Vagococcus lutrae]MDT2808672.1 F0F1 ATP synthase subunit gamma [Vagococcus lutrae]MDT2812957.1 F0F1 ATP synthase subunit gamma [Vagococcus lutrae]